MKFCQRSNRNNQVFISLVPYRQQLDPIVPCDKHPERFEQEGPKNLFSERPSRK